MFKTKHFMLAAFIASSLFACPLALAEESSCINWPYVMTKYEVDQAQGNISISIAPFIDYTKKAGDEWLVLGLKNFLADLLRTSGSIKVPEGVFDSSANSPEYMISGTFQRATDKLRIFISLKNKTGELLRQFEIVIPYPDNKEFFEKISGTVRQIMEILKAKPNSDQFAAITGATASTRAFESFSRGREILKTYSVANTDAAAKFFTDAKRIDYRSPLGYKGLMDLYAFEGFYYKQQGEPFESYFQKAEAEMDLLNKRTKPVSKKTKEPDKITNRLILGNIAFIEGMSAYKTGNLAAAKEALGRSTTLVPEDAMAWYQLSRVESVIGNTAAQADALQKARAINSCIE